ncbi:SCO family protein [Mucilaginibacter sp.]
MKKVLFCALTALALQACNLKQTHQQKLPILGNRNPVTKTVNGKTVTDTAYQTIPAFRYVNQYGDSITNKSLDGDIYVADFFFTSCPSICPTMHRNMLKVYNTFKDDGDFKIISYSIDPKHDSVAVLKKYADGLGITGKTWWLLQGKKDATYQLAQSYLARAGEDKNAAGGYVHDGYFVLIDKQKHIRGAYDGTVAEQVDHLIADIKLLKQEPEQTIAQ